MSRQNVLGLTYLLDDSCGTLRSPLVTFLAVVEFILSKSFQQYRQCYYQSFDVPLRFFFYLLSLFSLLLVICEVRGEKKNIGNTLKLRWQHHQHTVRKIWTRLIQRYQRRSPTVIEVHHKSRPKKNELWYIWTSRVAYFGHRSWPYLVSLHFSCWYLSNDIGGVVIRISACFQDFFYFFPCFLLSPFFLL